MNGCPLDQAFGTMENIKIKKKDKKDKKKGKVKEDIIYPTEIRRVSKDTTSFNDISGYDEKEKYDRAYISPHNDNYISHDIEEHILHNQYRDFHPTPEFQERRIRRQQQIDDRKHISDADYQEFKMFQKMRNMYARNKHLSNIEGFGNINDLLFGLTGIFFLILIDYIYKLGKKSY